MSEEAKVLAAENGTEVLTAFSRIPYALLNREVEGDTKDLLDELTQICQYYKIYKRGADFTVEGSNGDYVPATLRYKVAASLIDKEARFLFAESPDVNIAPKGDVGKISQEAKDALVVLNDIVRTVLSKNKFEESLIKAARDCFIGKRVVGLVNFNEEDGVTVSFLPSTQFVYETKVGNPNILTKLVCFVIVRDSISQAQKRIFRKRYVLEDDGMVYIEETMFDGAGRELEVLTEYQATKLDFIPAAVFINDGLTGEEKGESEIESLKHYEQWYSKLANADIDSERKSMNPTKFLVDMDANSTKGLSTAAGALWDLGSDQNLDKPAPQVGILEPQMNYSNALDTSLNRIQSMGYSQLDIPNVSNEALQGVITSGKALKAIYWPLIVRCKEKMKMWGPQLTSLVDAIIKGAMLYPNCVERYTNSPIIPVDYEIEVVQNTPLPEDEAEEKTLDLAEVEARTMSRKAYMKKWRSLSDYEVDEELHQIALERQLIDDSFMPQQGGLDLGLGVDV